MYLFYFLVRFIYDLVCFDMKGSPWARPLLEIVIHYVGTWQCVLVGERVPGDQDGYMSMHMYPNWPYTLFLTIYSMFGCDSFVWPHGSCTSMCAMLGHMYRVWPCIILGHMCRVHLCVMLSHICHVWACSMLGHMCRVWPCWVICVVCGHVPCRVICVMFGHVPCRVTCVRSSHVPY